MAVAAIGTTGPAFIFKVFVQLGVQNALRKRLLKIVEQSVLGNTSFGSRPGSSGPEVLSR